MNKFWHVYILFCFDEKPDTGCTNDLKDRINRQQKGEITTIKLRLPIKLNSYFAFSKKYTAFNFEKYLKSGSRKVFVRKHKIAIV